MGGEPQGVYSMGSVSGLVLLPESGVDLDMVEREFMNQALEKTDHNQTRAAKMLGLSRDALRYRMKKYDLL